MDELREKIVAILLDVGLSDGWQGGETEVADRILVIPEIAEALRRPWDTTGASELSGRSSL